MQVFGIFSHCEIAWKVHVCLVITVYAAQTVRKLKTLPPLPHRIIHIYTVLRV
jgi:hypothetical protein